MNSLDDLELELRKLPGVKAAGFDERDDMLLVQLHLGDQVDSAEHPVPIDASRIVARHVDERTAVEIVRWRAIPARGRAAPRPSSTDVDLTTAEPAVGRGAGRAGTRSRRDAATTAIRPAAGPACSRCSRSPTPTSSRCT